MLQASNLFAIESFLIQHPDVNLSLKNLEVCQDMVPLLCQLEHLKSLVYDYGPDMDRWLPELDRYLAEQRKNFLRYYIYATKMGETKSADVGPPIKSAGAGFSLATYIQSITEALDIPPQAIK